MVRMQNRRHAFQAVAPHRDARAAILSLPTASRTRVAAAAPVRSICAPARVAGPRCGAAGSAAPRRGSSREGSPRPGSRQALVKGGPRSEPQQCGGDVGRGQDMPPPGQRCARQHETEVQPDRGRRAGAEKVDEMKGEARGVEDRLGGDAQAPRAESAAQGREQSVSREERLAQQRRAPQPESAEPRRKMKLRRRIHYLPPVRCGAIVFGRSSRHAGCTTAPRWHLAGIAPTLYCRGSWSAVCFRDLGYSGDDPGRSEERLGVVVSRWRLLHQVGACPRRPMPSGTVH